MRLPPDVIDSLKLHAEIRGMGVSEALRDLIRTSIGALAEYEGELSPLVIGLSSTEIAALDRFRGARSRPEAIRQILAEKLPE